MTVDCRRCGEKLSCVICGEDAEARRDPRIEQWLVARLEDYDEAGHSIARDVTDELLSEYRLWADATYGTAS